MPTSVYPSDLNPRYVDEGQQATLMQLASTPGVMERLALLFQSNNALREARNPQNFSNAAYNASLQPGPISQDELAWRAGKVASEENPTFRSGVGHTDLYDVFPSLFSLTPDIVDPGQERQLSWGPTDYLGKLRLQALGRPSGFGRDPEIQPVKPSFWQYFQ